MAAEAGPHLQELQEALNSKLMPHGRVGAAESLCTLGGQLALRSWVNVPKSRNDKETGPVQEFLGS